MARKPPVRNGHVPLGGLENYEAVLSTDLFWLSLGRTFYFAGMAVAFELVVGFVLAMLVNQCTMSKKLYTTIFLLPMMIVPIVVGYNFSMIYIDSGPLNQLLAPFLVPFGIDPRIRWLSDPVRGPVRDHPRGHLAVDLADVPDLPVGVLRVAQGSSSMPPASWARPPGRFFLARAASTLEARHRDRRHHSRLMEALKLFDPVVLLTFGGPGTSTQTVVDFLWEQVWVFTSSALERRRRSCFDEDILGAHFTSLSTCSSGSAARSR